MRGGRKRLAITARASIALVLACLSMPASHAADPVTNPLDKLDQIESRIRKDRSQADALRQSADRLWRDQDMLRVRLIDAAARSQARERDLNTVERKLAALETREAAARRALDGQRARLAGLLAVLQRMGREPPPALVIRPLDATGAARSAMLLSSVVPAVNDVARRLGRDLAQLRQVRQAAAEERLRVAAAAGALEKDRNTLIQLIAVRRQMADRTVQNLQATTGRIRQLADEAADLRALIASLNEIPARPEIRRQETVITREIASAGAARSGSLEDLRGQLKLPANGRLSGLFGSNDGLGGRLSGIFLDTYPGSVVTAPCDGKIVFAGPFRGYGPMLIIAANGGYHILLAGLTDVDGVVGQVVLAGEPLGRMGVDQAAMAPGNPVAIRGSQVQAKRLYIEFRRNSIPVDPAPWFASLRERVSG